MWHRRRRGVPHRTTQLLRWLGVGMILCSSLLVVCVAEDHSADQRHSTVDHQDLRTGHLKHGYTDSRPLREQKRSQDRSLRDARSRQNGDQTTTGAQPTQINYNSVTYSKQGHPTPSKGVNAVAGRHTVEKLFYKINVKSENKALTLPFHYGNLLPETNILSVTNRSGGSVNGATTNKHDISIENNTSKLFNNSFIANHNSEYIENSVEYNSFSGNILTIREPYLDSSLNIYSGQEKLSRRVRRVQEDPVAIVGTPTAGGTTGADKNTTAGPPRNAASPPAPVNCSCDPGRGSTHAPAIRLATIRWDEVGVYFTITAFVIFAGLGKLGFHQLHWLSSKVPESCLLIVLGLLMGVLIHFITHAPGASDPYQLCQPKVTFPTFSSETFFLVLLPPIILESAYSLHDRSFIENLGTVLIFAVIGTLLNTFIIGPTLYGLAAVGAMGSLNITLTESLVFSSLISAVDPVAVLNIFQDLGVNKGLYFLVFGESLLNDGVTVVVYNTLSVFMELEDVTVKDYVLSVAAFFVVTLCGALLGLVYGILTALVTRITTTVRVVEPLALLGFAYLAYLTAELFHFSGIISLVVCGLVQAHYAFQNISSKSYTCVKYFTKMASATSETIIFMFLGMVMVRDDHAWHTGFVLWTLALCFAVRFMITLSLSALTNQFRVHPIGMSEQLILAYGGLRGAVAFSLVTMLPPDLPLRSLFITATLCVVLFTVFIQGITIRPLVNWLNVSKRKSGPRQLFEEVHQSVVDHMMAGIEEVMGHHGNFYLREQLRGINEKYLKKWFVRPTCEAPLKRLFEKIAITEHYAHLYGPAVLLQQQQQLSLSSEKLIESPYASKRSSVQCLDSERTTELPVDNMVLTETMPGAVPIDVQIRHTTKTGKEAADTHVEMAPSTPTTSVDADAKLLRRAISSNPYNQLHYTYNRNLVNADLQEVSEHLQRRHENARRLTQLASRGSHRLSSPSVAPSVAAAQLSHPLPGSCSSTHAASTESSRAAASGAGRPSSTETIVLSPEDLDQIRRPAQLRQSGWIKPRTLLDRMASLPGEVRSQQNEQIDSFSECVAILDSIERVNDIIAQHSRQSEYNRSVRRRRTTSDPQSPAPGRSPLPTLYDSDCPSAADPLLYSAGGGTGDSEVPRNTRQYSTPCDAQQLALHGRPPFLPSFSTPETSSQQSNEQL